MTAMLAKITNLRRKEARVFGDLIKACTKERVFMPQDGVAGFFINFETVFNVLGKDSSFKHSMIPLIFDPPPYQDKQQRSIMRFWMGDFGVCKKISLELQANSRGLIFLRSVKDLIEVSAYKNPLRDPLEVTYFKDVNRYFLMNGFHRLVEAKRRGYNGAVYVVVNELPHAPPTRYPCFFKTEIDKARECDIISDED
jgi:hypothetical protein